MKRPTIVFASLVLMIMACQTIAGGAPEVSEEAPTPVVEEETTEVEPTAAPTRTPAPEASATPEPQVSIEVAQVVSRRGEKGDLTVIALLKNTGNVEVEGVEVTLIVRDASGSEVFSKTRPSAFISVIRSGETVPSFSYIMETEASIPPDYDVEFSASARQATSSYAVETVYRGVEVISAEGQRTSGGGYEILGEVKNAGEFDADLVHAAVALFDLEGKMVGYGSFYPDFRYIAAGETSPFHNTWSKAELLGPAVDHFMIIVEADKVKTASTPKGTPQGEAPFEIVDLNWYYGLSGNVTVIGLVKNKASFGLEAINVSITLRDKDNLVVGHEVGPTYVHVVAAGETVPFEILFIEAPAREVADVQVGIDARPESNFYPITRDLEIIEAVREDTTYGAYRIVGKVKNTSDEDLSSVTVAAAVFDKEGKLVGAAAALIEEDALDREQTSNFEIIIAHMGEGGEPDRFELFVEGWFE